MNRIRTRLPYPKIEKRRLYITEETDHEFDPYHEANSQSFRILGETCPDVEKLVFGYLKYYLDHTVSDPKERFQFRSKITTADNREFKIRTKFRQVLVDALYAKILAELEANHWFTEWRKLAIENAKLLKRLPKET